jgi:hypothetical protein
MYNCDRVLPPHIAACSATTLYEFQAVNDLYSKQGNINITSQIEADMVIQIQCQAVSRILLTEVSSYSVEAYTECGD